MPDDIIVIYKIIIENGSIAYQIYLFPEKLKSEQYRKLESVLEKKGTYGSHALISLSDISFINLDVHIDTSRVFIPDEVKEAVLSEEEVQLIPKEELSKEFEFTNFIRETAFRDLLLYFYDFKCAITGTVIRYGNLLNLEAAHIIPAELKGPAHPRNGIPLNRDMHWAFDKGLFTIDDSYIVKVHEKARSNKLLLDIDGKKIFLPEDSRARPSNFSLKWHRENTFGVFLNFV
jgi:predicted restriction endonuclease